MVGIGYRVVQLGGIHLVFHVCLKNDLYWLVFVFMTVDFDNCIFVGFSLMMNFTIVRKLCIIYLETFYILAKIVTFFLLNNFFR